MTRRRLVATIALGGLLYAGAFWLVLTRDLGDGQTMVPLVVAAGLVFTVVGAIAAAQRPDNATSTQLLAVGLLWSLGSLQAAEGALASRSVSR